MHRLTERRTTMRRTTMRRAFKRYIRFMALCLVAAVWYQMGAAVFAEEKYKNETTGYPVLIEDDADLLTEEEEDDLAELMKGITEYGGAALKTIDYNSRSTQSYIKEYYSDTFGQGSGTVFLIDMDNRNIWVHSNGRIYQIITTSYADTITDNVYKYAADADYYGCCYEAFSEMLTLLQGNRIAQPMKYISNILLSIILALFIMYFVVRWLSRAKKPKEWELLEATRHQYQLDNQQAVFTHTTKTYDPPSSSSGGGGHGGGGGGGHGGGGGGHSF